jgi:hypothetical protein
MKTIWIPTELHDTLKRRAKKLGVPMYKLASDMIDQYTQELCRTNPELRRAMKAMAKGKTKR